MISVVQLGRVDYATGLKLQQSLVELRHSGRIPNVLLLLEHPPVITLGRNADRGHVLASPDLLRDRGVEVFACDRGGDVTYHGPGQLVGYPIFDLRSFNGSEPGKRQAVGAIEYVRRLEEALIRTAADFGVATERIKGMTGVWTQPSVAHPAAPQPDGLGESEARRSEQLPKSAPAKIAAIGVHISRGITSHGFALNVNTDLGYFQLIVPCGIASKPVTSLSKETGSPLSLETVAQSVARNFGRVFNAQILWVETLDALLGATVGIPVKPPEELRKLHEEDVFWA